MCHLFEDIQRYAGGKLGMQGPGGTHGYPPTYTVGEEGSIS